MKMGDIISARRKELNMTQQELADRLYVSPKTISKWETNRGLPEISMITLISRVLDLNVEELLSTVTKDKSEEPSPKNRKILSADMFIGYGIVLLGLLFFILNFYSFTLNNIADDIFGDIFGNIIGQVTIYISGYDALFKLNANDFGGVLLILTVWISFLAILAYGITHTIQLFVPDDHVKEVAKKWKSLIPYVGLGAIVLNALMILANGGIQIGVVMVAFYYIAIVIYQWYIKKQIRTNE